MANLLKLKTTFDGKNIRTNGKINLGAFKDYFPKEDAEQIAGKVNGMISDFNKQLAAYINERIAKNS